MAPHRPKGVIGHDGCIGKDGAGISGLWFLEALGIPAATADGMSAELGNGLDLYETGVISRLNIYAERCGVVEGMPVAEAAKLLLNNDPGEVDEGTKIRREVKATSSSGREIVVTDSIVFALPEDSRNVLVTAGHTGRSGADFLLGGKSPWLHLLRRGPQQERRRHRRFGHHRGPRTGRSVLRCLECAGRRCVQGVR